MVTVCTNDWWKYHYECEPMLRIWSIKSDWNQVQAFTHCRLPRSYQRPLEGATGCAVGGFSHVSIDFETNVGTVPREVGPGRMLLPRHPIPPCYPLSIRPRVSLLPIAKLVSRHLTMNSKKDKKSNPCFVSKQQVRSKSSPDLDLRRKNQQF